ncbi:MAG: MFS transporter, partial [Candidatus Dormibacteraceae bacterium]
MLRKLSPLTVGAFAIGTDVFVVAGLLPNIAHSLSVSPALAGQLVTAFALIYAIASPILAVVTGTVGRKTLIVLVLLIFAAANVLAAVSTSYPMLLGARVLAACCAALFTPNASALAVAMVSLEQRGQALAVVSGGVTLA